MINFGKYLKDIRKNRCLTLRSVEKQSGVSNAYLSQIESGKRKCPSIEILKKLAIVYQISLNELLQKAGYIEIETDIEKYIIERIRNDPTLKYILKIYTEKLSEYNKNLLKEYVVFLLAKEGSN